MLFTDPFFIFIFLPLVIGGFHLFNRYSSNLALLFLTFSSFIFYSWDQPQFVFLLLFIVLISWYMGNLIRLSTNNSNKKILLILSLALMLLPLVYYKYLYFIASNLPESFITEEIMISAKSIILPIGISFYTFQAISYLIDVYSGQIKGNNNFIRYSAYVTMFPQLVAGPIVRFKEISAQLVSPRITRNDISVGTYFFVIGLSKKVLIADSLAPLVDMIFDGGIGNEYNFYIIIIGSIAYALQIYFDFSGYSEMAIGIARFFGFKLPQNFNSPYKATSLTEFWQRWHMSLSFWIRDYVYYPILTQNLRRSMGNFSKYSPHIVAMLIFGIWHGAGWNFVIWGGGHGMALVFENIFFKNTKSKMIKIIRVIFTFSIILLLFIPFRSPDIQTTFIMWCSLTDFEIKKLSYMTGLLDLKIALSLVTIPIALYLVFLKKNIYQMNTEIALNSALLLNLLLFCSIFIMLSRPYIPFLYFQF
jgi:alginate O-acetyltransferase complex protein AlgI